MHAHRLVAAGLVLVVGTTVGCGGSPPTDASTEDFCRAFKSLLSHTADLPADVSDSDAAESAEDWGKELAEVGTPVGIPDQARRGFEVTVEGLANAGDMADGDFEDLPDVSQEDVADTKVFSQYAITTCPVGASDLELLQ